MGELACIKASFYVFSSVISLCYNLGNLFLYCFRCAFYFG